MGNDLYMILPELVLTVGALVLMLVAAWGGQGSTRLVSWASVAVLVGAGIALAGPASSGGQPFDGLLRTDAFAAYAKVLIYAATAVSIIIAPGFFARTSGDDLRPEYPVLMLLAAIGSGVMVSAGDMLALYVGLELQSLASYVLASFMRRDTRSPSIFAAISPTSSLMTSTVTLNLKLRYAILVSNIAS